MGILDEIDRMISGDDEPEEEEESDEPATEDDLDGEE